MLENPLESHFIFIAPYNPTEVLGNPPPRLLHQSNSTVKPVGQTPNHEELNTRPWPQIKNILENSHFREMLESNTMASVSEKLDGSNISFNSLGDVASRRCVLLRSATKEQLCSYRFGGQSLEHLIRPMACCKKLSSEVFAKFFPLLKVIVTVYGEFIQEGTASSKADKFKYQNRGFERANVYAFGVGISFEEELTKDEIEKARNVLSEKGFSALLHSGGTEGKGHFCILILNIKLVNLLQNFGFQTLRTQEMPLASVFQTFRTCLLGRDVIEGVVITIPSEGRIYKWKGVEDSFSPQRLKALKNLKKTLADWPAVIGPIIETVENALRIQMEVKQEQMYLKNLKKALKSAQSKYPTAQEYIAKSNDTKEKSLQRYALMISNDIKEDAEGDENFAKAIERFVHDNVVVPTRKSFI